MIASIVAAALTLSLGGPAAAPDDALELHWSAPPSCPDQARVRAMIDELTARGERVGPARASITVSPVEDGLVSTLRIEAEGRDERRELQSDDCLLLARASAVVVAVALDPIAVAEATADRPEPTPIDLLEPPPTEPAEPPLTEPAEPGSSRLRPRGSDADARPRYRIDYGVGVHAGAAAALLPRVGFGFGLAPWIGVRQFQVRAVARYFTRRRVDLDPQLDVAAELRLATAGVRVCPVVEAGTARFPMCAGIDAGAILGRGRGDALAASTSARAPWVGVAIEPGIEVPMARFLSVWLSVEGTVSLYRPKFTVEGAQQVWTAGPGGIRGMVGLAVHRPRHFP